MKMSGLCMRANRVRQVGFLGAAVAGLLLCGACATSDEISSGAVAPLSAVGTSDTLPRPDIAARAARVDYRAGWASRLIGEPVIDSRGRHLGLLKDFVVDPGTGAVRYAIISDKRPPNGERLVAAPVRLLRVSEQGSLFLGADRERIHEQPAWAAEPSLRDRVVWDEIDRLWGMPPVPASERDNAHRVSRLMGRYVDDLQGLALGRIVDVVMDMNRQQVHYAVLRLQGHAGIAPNHAFAVPVQSLVFPGGSSDRLALAVPQARLISLVGTDPDQGPPANDLRYLGTIDRPFGVAFPREPVGAEPGAVGATAEARPEERR